MKLKKMKNSILIISILFVLGLSYNANAATYYVTASGSSLNNGLTQGSPWSITHAFSSAVAGDIVYVSAGNYGNVNVVQNNNGTNGNLITFIGCDNSFNPIVTTNRATYTRTDVFSGSDLPYLNGGLVAGQRASNGIGFIINGSYVRVENFAIKGFEEGIRNYGSNCVFRNINTDFMGDMREDNANTSIPNRWDYYLGRSQSIFGANNLIENCFHRDADSQGLTISGDNNTLNHIEVYTSASCPNTTDYQFLFGSSYNQCSDINIIREVGTLHLSHGICFKPVGRLAEYNVVDGFYCENSRVEIQFGGTQNNIIKNGEINGTTTQSSSEWSSGIVTANGASFNLLENIYVHDTYAAFFFSDWNDGASSNPSEDMANAGTDNTYVNITCDNIWMSVVYCAHGGGGTGFPSNNKFYNLSVNNSPRFIRTFIDNSGFEFYNTTIKDITSTFLLVSGGPGLNSNTVFNTINGVNIGGFNFSPYNDNNITTVPFNYTNPSIGDFSITSNVLDIGGDFTSIEPRQGFDFYQATRTAPFTIGAVEFSSGGVCTPDSSTINALIDSGSSYTFNTQTLTSPGTYNDTLINAGGCDSLVTLNLSFNAIYEVCKKNNTAQIVIDGSDENLWSTIDSVNLSKTFIGQTVPSTSDLSSNYKIIWDNTSLYILVKVNDDTLSSDSPSYINDDAISIYIDGLNENNSSYDANDHNIGLKYGTNVIVHNGATYSGSGIIKSEIATAGGYQMEVKIDFSVLGITPSTLNPIGLDIHVNDDDDGGNRDAKIMWNDASDLAYTNPSKLGMLVLSDECYNYTTICNNSLSVVIDGVEDPQWTAQEDTLIKIIDGAITNDADASATYKLMWDATNLYILANVTDDIKINDSPNSWDDDGIEIFIDGDNDKNSVYDADDRQYIIRWNDNTVYEYGFNVGTNPSGVIFAQTNTPNGYVIEGSISWVTLGITPSLLTLVGFDIQLNDDDLGGGLDGRRSWNALVSPSANASLMGVASLDSLPCNNTTNSSVVNLNKLKIYPNPTTNDLTVTSGSIIDKIEIYNLLGEIIKSIESINGLTKTIDVSQLSKGTYFIKAYQSNDIQTKEIIKN